MDEFGENSRGHFGGGFRIWLDDDFHGFRF
jgi:hypothetical protein